MEQTDSNSVFDNHLKRKIKDSILFHHFFIFTLTNHYLNQNIYHINLIDCYTYIWLFVLHVLLCHGETLWTTYTSIPMYMHNS